MLPVTWASLSASTVHNQTLDIIEFFPSKIYNACLNAVHVSITHYQIRMNAYQPRKKSEKLA